MKNCLAVQYDDRAKLGWPGRFADVASVAVNFYSTGDEVLELAADNDINVLRRLNLMPFDKNLEWDMKTNLCPRPGCINNKLP